ncbi:semaphorin-3D-like [Acipenser oxyrinchus oxyrinchus]|uniref:Semaphorin-3D-like n=1 Tax=Acipenser oxyrinchus oxyrinchus TaxID=40147 RepID=A0AAD8D379_ACIOX|nr:semaphorin-3D-like [Acipenser oxyrinchus oxyrinchus]
MGFLTALSRRRTLLLCLLIQLLQVTSWSSAWTQGAPRLRLSFRDLQTSNSSTVIIGSINSSSYQALLLDEDRGWLLAGAKNHIFLFHSDNLNESPDKIYWPAAKDHVEHCKLAGKNAETECANFIRLLQHFNKTHVYACGTGAFHPVCTYIDLGLSSEEPTFLLIPHLVESGRGKCPYSPLEPFTAVLTDEKLYAGTSVDFMGTNAALFRTAIQGSRQHYIRTEANQDHWLNDPKFIGSYSIPDTHSPDDDKVYFFFKETAVESNQWDKRIYTRVARVCKNDVGGKRSLINRWTTFLKARLVCSVPGPEDRDTYFDELEDIFLLETRDEQNPLVFGVFSASSAVFKGSAVCVYSMASIRAAFKGPFAHKEGLDYRWVEYKGRIPYPRPGTCPSETYDPLHKSTQDFPDDVISFMRGHQLMWEVVHPLNRKPVFVRTGAPYLLKKVVVDRVEADDGQYNVLYLATDEGKVLKVISIPKESWQSEAIVLEELSVFQKPTPILNMKLSTKRQQLYVSSVSGVAQVSLHRCDLYGKACADCCLARDPYCAWDGSSCSRYFPTNKRRARRQDVKHGDPKSQCHDIGDGFDDVEEKVIYGVETNSTYLECVPRSQQTSIRWTVQHPRADHSHELKNDDRFVYMEHGILIHQLETRDAGIYSCMAEELSFSHTIARYSLRVIEHEHIGAPPSRGGAASRVVGGVRQGPTPFGPSHLHYKDYMQLSISGMSADEYCDQIWHRTKRRQKMHNLKWKQALENRKGRVRRHPRTE